MPNRNITELIKGSGRWVGTAVAPLAGSAVSAAYAVVTDHPYLGVGAGAIGVSAGTWFVAHHIATRRERRLAQVIHQNFAELAQSAETFEQRVNEIYLDHLSQGGARERQLNTLKAAMFAEITVRAKAIFDAKKPKYAPFSANLKVLRRNDHLPIGESSSMFCYEVLTRSHTTDRTKQYDRWLRERHIPIEQNPVYWSFLRPAGPDDNFEQIPLYEMHGDLEARVKQLAENDHSKRIEPNQQLVCALMRSYFVHAISSPVPAEQADPGWYRTRGLYVPALLCVDCHSKSAFVDADGFERDADLAIMQLLCATAFRVFSVDVRERVHPAPAAPVEPPQVIRR
jgi:hypothetical protein